MTCIIFRLNEATPAPLKSILRATGISRLLFRFLDRFSTELAFQTQWAKEFRGNRSSVLKYWKKYRHLSDINAICGIRSNTRVLDVGCGISTVLHFIYGRKYGIDPLADEYKKLYPYPEWIDVRKGSGEDIPFPDGYFNVVFCSNVLDHILDPQRTIIEIHRVLKKNGYFVLTVTVFKEKEYRDPAHPHAFTKGDVYSLLGCRFKIVFEKVSPFVGLRAYVNGSTRSHNVELIMILRKV